MVLKLIDKSHILVNIEMGKKLVGGIFISNLSKINKCMY